MTLQVASLGFSYNRGQPVLRDVSFTLAEGELLALLGPNGSGKSTLLKCLAGILKPEQGHIMLHDASLAEMSPRQRARCIGYVPQQAERVVPATVFDTVLTGRRPYAAWAPGQGDLKVTADVLSLLGLDDISLREVTELSGGQRQKVFIARALVQQPSVLLLDEPTNNLDLRHQVEVMDIVAGQASRGVAAIMALHDINTALRYADRILLLHHGAVAAAGGPEVLTPELIANIYEVTVTMTEHGGIPVVMPDKR